jgi:hypothetical protein
MLNEDSWKLKKEKEFSSGYFGVYIRLWENKKNKKIGIIEGLSEHENYGSEGNATKSLPISKAEIIYKNINSARKAKDFVYNSKIESFGGVF